MEFKARTDAFGNPENVTSADLHSILYLLDNYRKGKPYAIKEMWRDDVKDPNGRIDVEIMYEGEDGKMYEQKLLILKGEVIDGLTFHERYSEWYPKDGGAAKC